MKMVPHEDYGDLMTSKEFASSVKSSFFTSWDGSGYWATITEMDRESPVFVDDKFTKKPEWATHVMWFNK